MDRTQVVTVLSIIGILILSFVAFMVWTELSLPAMNVVTSAPDSFNGTLVDAINAGRSQKLKESFTLDMRAEARASFLCGTDIGVTAHDSFYPDGSKSILNDLSLTSSESIIQNVRDASTTVADVNLSYDHNKDVLNPAYEYVGIGHVTCPANLNGNKYMTVEFFTGKPEKSI